MLAGPLLNQRHFLNVMKYLGNELQLPIVAVGTQDRSWPIGLSRCRETVLPWEIVPGE